jgi:hypothetical protein
MEFTKDWITFTHEIGDKVFTLEFTTSGPDQNLCAKFTKDGAISNIYTLSAEEKQQLKEWLSLMAETP